MREECYNVQEFLMLTHVPSLQVGYEDGLLAFVCDDDRHSVELETIQSEQRGE